MNIKTVILVCILFLAIIAFSCPYGRSKPEVKLPVEEVELLQYEAIDFGKILTKPEVVPIPTDRDPFSSSLENLKLLDTAGKDQALKLGAESLKLTGIIRGPNGPVALIKPAAGEKNCAVKLNNMIGKFSINKITDNEVILTINEEKTVLKLGGEKND